MILQLANPWLIPNSGGGPTDDKPTVTLEQPQYQASELMISAALHGFRLAEVPTTMRDRGVHATQTKKGGNFGYGVRFARAALRTWTRDRNAAR